MRKITFLMFFFSLIALFSSFAVDSGNLQFNYHWTINNEKFTTITILQYSGSGSLPQDQQDRYIMSIAPEDESSLYPVCMIKYVTNVNGTHKVRFSATPLVSATTSNEVPYSLHITYNDSFDVVLDVQPEEQENSKLIDFGVIGSGETTVNIYLDAKITAYGTMEIGNYSSIVTIERVTE